MLFATAEGNCYLVGYKNWNMKDTLKPSWGDAPKWAKWLAQDEEGKWHWHEEKPHPCEDHEGGGVWGRGNKYQRQEAQATTPWTWEDTLQKRP